MKALERSRISNTVTPLGVGKHAAPGASVSRAHFVPFLLAALVIVGGLMVLPLGPHTAVSVTDAADAPPTGEFSVQGEAPTGSFQVYGTGLVAALFLVGVALLTKGRFYP